MTFFSVLKTRDKFVYLHQIPSMIYSNKEHWSICSNTYFMDTVGFAFTTTPCAFQTRRAKLSHCEEFDNKRHIRWIQSTWREKRTCNHFRSVQINIFFIFVCIHVSTMRCENCTVRPSVHKMKRCFPGGISSARWLGINMDAQLSLLSALHLNAHPQENSSRAKNKQMFNRARDAFCTSWPIALVGL